MIEWVALHKSKAEAEIKQRTEKAEADIKQRTEKAEADIKKNITSHVAVLKKWEDEKALIAATQKFDARIKINGTYT